MIQISRAFAIVSPFHFGHKFQTHAQDHRRTGFPCALCKLPLSNVKPQNCDGFAPLNQGW